MRRKYIWDKGRIYCQKPAGIVIPIKDCDSYPFPTTKQQQMLLKKKKKKKKSRKVSFLPEFTETRKKALTISNNSCKPGLMNKRTGTWYHVFEFRYPRPKDRQIIQIIIGIADYGQKSSLKIWWLWRKNVPKKSDDYGEKSSLKIWWLWRKIVPKNLMIMKKNRP